MNIINDTPELRAELDAHNANAIRLHLPTAPVTWIDMKVEAPDGTVVHEHREKANSWNRNFYDTLASVFLPAVPNGSFEAGGLPIKNTGGSVATSTKKLVSPMGNNSLTEVVGSIDSLASGIIVGTGTSSESFEGFVIETPIATGNSAGQLAYSAGTLGTPSYNSETKKWTQTVERVFNNNTADPITVSEVGWYRTMAVVIQSTYMLDRSLLAEAVAVPAAYKLTVTYTTEITFPA